MAIDTTMMGASIPAGTYAAGDTFPLGVCKGASVVRDGYGTAQLKRVFTIQNGTVAITGHIELKNSNWVDKLSNAVPSQSSTTALSEQSNAIQSGHDCVLQPNSTWESIFIVDYAVTTTAKTDIVVLIDIDYSGVGSIKDPTAQQGVPCTSNGIVPMNVAAGGDILTMGWTTVNVDILKAGYSYLLAGVSFRTPTPAANVGFLSISGAAGQGGLERIIPCLPNTTNALRYKVDYSTPLVKGPFNLNFAGVGVGGGSSSAIFEIDWVKRAAKA